MIISKPTHLLSRIGKREHMKSFIKRHSCKLTLILLIIVGLYWFSTRYESPEPCDTCKSTALKDTTHIISNDKIEKYLFEEHNSLKNSADVLYNQVMQLRLLLFTILFGILALFRSTNLHDRNLLKYLSVIFLVVIFFVYFYDCILMTQYDHIASRNARIKDALKVVSIAGNLSFTSDSIFVPLEVKDISEKLEKLGKPDKIAFPIYIVLVAVTIGLIVHTFYCKHKIVWLIIIYAILFIILPILWWIHTTKTTINDFLKYFF
jgi:hypothetical protein